MNDVTNYAGEFNFEFTLDDDQTSCFVDIYDGDADFYADSDDPNTAQNIVYPFVLSDETVDEGINPGNPDDGSNREHAFKIAPAVQYFVAGQNYAVVNNDPSGNSEWELFRIASSNPDCPPNPMSSTYDPDNNGPAPAAAADAVVENLHSGAHQIAVKGLDAWNSIYFSSSVSINPAKERQHCAGQMTWLVLEYTGTIQDAHIVVTQGTGGNLITVFDGTVQPGELFTFAGQKASGTFGSKINITVDDQHNVEIVTTCSNKAEALRGESFGDFIIRDGASLNGGLLL